MDTYIFQKVENNTCNNKTNTGLNYIVDIWTVFQSQMKFFGP